jgi:hypothetical protein
MARPVNQARWNQWRRLVARQRASGLSVAEFCRRENVSRPGFHVWKRKLRQDTAARRASGEAAPALRSRKRQPPVASRRPFRRVLVKPAMPRPAPGFLQLPLTAVQSSPWIELALADGTIVRLPQQNLAAVVAVLRVLRGEPQEPCQGDECRA